LDAVGTVIEPSPSVADAYQAVGLSHGLDLDRETIRRRFREAIAKYSVHAFQTLQGSDDPLRTSEASELARWRAIVSFVLSPQPTQQDEVFQQLWDHFGKAKNWCLYDDVRPALNRLADEGFRLGLASNFDGRLRSIVEKYLADFELQLFISSEVGWVKPAQSFYQRATDALECQPNDILLIGDDWKNDVEAPWQFGWQAMYLARSGRPDNDAISRGYSTLEAVADALLES